MSYDLTAAFDEEFKGEVDSILVENILNSLDVVSGSNRHYVYKSSGARMEISLENVDSEGNYVGDEIMGKLINCIRFHITSNGLNIAETRNYYEVAHKITSELKMILSDDQTGEIITDKELTEIRSCNNGKWWKFWK
jgi:hypothetical protein